MEPDGQEYAYDSPADDSSQWSGAGVGAAGSAGDQLDGADPLLGFDQAPPTLSHGGLDVGGLTLPASVTDPLAHPTDPNSLSPNIFEPLPPEPHHAPSTVGEKIYDAVVHPAPPPAPPEDPTELERQRQEHASQNAIGQHTPMSPEMHF
jgi:hypothetical protein